MTSLHRSLRGDSTGCRRQRGGALAGLSLSLAFASLVLAAGLGEPLLRDNFEPSIFSSSFEQRSARPSKPGERTNSAPVVRSVPNARAVVGKAYEYQVDAIDPEGGPIRFSLSMGPPQMQLSASGRLTWKPEKVGRMPVLIAVADELGAKTTQSFAIEVTQADAASSAAVMVAAQNLDPGDVVANAPLGVLKQSAQMEVRSVYAPGLGVLKQAVPPVESTDVFTTAPLGVLRGAGVTSLDPNRVEIDITNQQLTVGGFGLGMVASAIVEPAADVLVTSTTPGADGLSVSLSIDVSTNAQAGVRRLTLLDSAGDKIPVVDPAAQQLLVAAPAPEVISVEPILLTRGDSSSLLVRGRNLRFSPGDGAAGTSNPIVHIEPPDDIVLGAESFVNADGTQVTIPFSSNASAVLGDRVVRIETASGISTPQALDSNTISLVGTPLEEFSPVVSAPLGVSVGMAMPVNRFASSNPVGVLLGPGVIEFSPTIAPLNQRTTLEIVGQGLADAVSVEVLPTDGITVDAGSFSAQNELITVAIDVDDTAPLVPRRIVVNTAAGTLSVPGTLTIRGAPPVIDALTPTFLVRDGVAQTIALQGRSLGQTTGARLIPDDGIVLQDYSIQSSEQATITLLATPGTQLGPRVVQLIGPNDSSTDQPTTTNLLYVIDATSIRSPYASPVLGVLKQATSQPEPPVSVFSAQTGVVVGAYADDVSPASLARGQTTIVTVSGAGLDAVTAVSLEAADGLILDNLVVDAGGQALSFTVNVAADAAPGDRAVILSTADSSIRFVPSSAGAITVLDNDAQAPIALDDTYDVIANGLLAVSIEEGVLANDIDPSGQPLTAVLASFPSSGTVILDSSGSLVYTPAPDFVGIDLFEYRAFNGAVAGNTARVRFVVDETNNALDDSYSTPDNQVLVVDAQQGLLANDQLVPQATVVAALETSPSLGDVVLNEDGSFSYTPDAPGLDSFTYRLLDDNGSSLPATVTIDVMAVNDPPVTVADFYAVDRDDSLSVSAASGVLANDSDPDGDSLTARLLSNPAEGALSLQADGGFSYTPPAGFVGVVTFDYEAVDPAGLATPQTVTITVNDTLAALPDFYSVNEGEILLVETVDGLLANDSINAQGALRIEVEQSPALGEVQVANDGAFVYEPNDPDVFGTDTFVYRLVDDVNLSLPATVTITIVPINDPPTVNADSYLSDENADLTIAAPGVLDNDVDDDSAGITAELSEPPQFGVVQLNPDGSFSYIPEVNFRGQDTFSYLAIDDGGEQATGTVTIDVTQPPTATNDVYFVDVNTTLQVDDVDLGLLVNDHDAPEDDELFAQLAEAPLNGDLSLNEDGTFIYVPETDFSGIDTFTYQVTDTRSVSNIGTVTMAVGITSFPRAVPDAYELFEDQQFVVAADEGVLVNDEDADTPLADLEAFLIGFDSNGVASISVDRDGGFRLTPRNDFFGETFFVYQVFDGTDVSNAAIVSLTVLPFNDGVVANDDQFGVLSNTIFDSQASGQRPITFNDRYDNDFEVNFEITVPPQSGQLVLDEQRGHFVYTPDQGFAGLDTFTYRAFQPATGIGDTAVVSLRTNSPPVANPDVYELTEDELSEVSSPLINDTDPDGDDVVLVNPTVSYFLAEGRVLQTADNATAQTVRMLPQFDIYGTWVLPRAYRISDGVQSAFGQITFVIAPVPDDPRASRDSYLTQRNTVLTINDPRAGVLGNDYDPDRRTSPGATRLRREAAGPDRVPLVARLRETTTNGTLTFSPTGTFSYAPNQDFSGTDEFSYDAVDATGRSSEVVTVSIRVNSPAVAVDDAYVATEDVPLIVDAADGLLVNDTDSDGDSLRASFAASGCAPCNGSVSVRADGGFQYTPNRDFHGEDEFFYRVSDGVAGFSVGRVAISVLPVNDPPLTEPDTYRTSEDEVLIAPEPQGTLRNDEEVDGDELVNAQLIVNPQNGSANFDVDGAFTYTPDVNFNGRDTFVYRVFDTTGLFTDEQVEVLLTPVNDAPTAEPDQYTVAQDEVLSVSASQGVLINDADVDGPSLTAALISPPNQGTVSLNADGAFVYRPNGLFSGVDQFRYQLDDGLGEVASAEVSIVVNPVAPDVVVEATDDRYQFAGPRLEIDPPGVLGNDSVSGAAGLSAAVVVEPDVGVVTLNPDGSFVYIAPDGFAGRDGFSYAANAEGVSQLARVTLDVQSVENVPPQAVGEQFAMLEDQLLDSRNIASLLANDSDFENQPLAVELESTTQQGELTMLGDGHFTYQPESNYAGPDSFSYRVSDGEQLSIVVEAGITVFPQNDAPRAEDDLYQTPQDQPLLIGADTGLLSNDTDIDGDDLIIELVDSPLFGQLLVNPDGSFQYQPNLGFAGQDTFRYSASDLVARDLAEVTISVVAPGNQPPIAMGEQLTTTEDNELVADLASNDSDPNQDPLQAVLVTDPENGTVELNGTQMTYRPAANYNGTDSVSYQMSDGELLSAVVVAQITVDPVNDPPTAQTDSYVTVQGEALSVAMDEGVIRNDSDLENSSLSVTVETLPAHGSLDLAMDGSFSYAPVATFVGRDEFVYRLSDGELSASGRVVIDVTAAANQRPIALGEMFQMAEDAILDTRSLYSLLANDSDPEGNPLTLNLLDSPAAGGVEQFDGGHVRYVPDRDFFGEDVFRYEVSDGELVSEAVEVRITVTPLNDPPRAQADVYAVPQADGVLVVTSVDGLLGNDVEPDGDQLIAELVEGPTAGELQLGLDGSFRYTNISAADRDEFTYQVRDPSGFASQATVTLLLDGSIPPPTGDVLFDDGFESQSP